MFNLFQHIKYRLRTIFFFAGISCLIACHNFHLKPPPPDDIDDQLHKMPPPDKILEAEGTVMNYVANKDGDIDKLVLQMADGTLVLHFPPHTAKQVISIAAKNTGIHVWFDSRSKLPEHENDDQRFELVSLRSKATDKTLDIHDIPPPQPVPGTEIVVKGNAIQWQQGNHHFILSGKLIALSPHEGESLLPLIKNAHLIIVKGYERDASDGFINLSGLIMVKPYAITIDSVNYIVP